MSHKIVAVLSDLMFTVKIADAAKRAGVAIVFAGSPEDALAKSAGAAAVILDLNFIPLDLIVRLKSGDRTRAIPLVGYVSHVQADVIRAAREAGCDTVMARSAFVQKLAQMMAEWGAPAVQ